MLRHARKAAAAVLRRGTSGCATQTAALCPDRSPTPSKGFRGAWWLGHRGGAATPYTLSCAGSGLASALQPPLVSPALPPPPLVAKPTARVLDGRAMAAAWTADVGAAIAARARALGAPVRPPGLAVVLVGESPDSLLYVRRKRDACAAAGISFSLLSLPDSADQAAVLTALRSAVDDPEIHGVLVQLPLPPHIDEEAVLEAIGTDKGPPRLTRRDTRPTRVSPSVPRR